ncbi:unnamed protein product [Heterosigma akashiwo]
MEERVRVVVLTGEGKLFSSGLDVTLLAESVSSSSNTTTGHAAVNNMQVSSKLQRAFNSIEQCNVPVIAAVHSFCLGGAVDMICACDIRYCSADARFAVLEARMGFPADLGTLQRLPKIAGSQGLARELAYTARPFGAEEACALGLVSRVLPDKDSLMEAAMETARQIAQMNPLAVSGTKVNLLYSQDHSIRDSLEFAALWHSMTVSAQPEAIQELVSSQLAQLKRKKRAKTITTGGGNGTAPKNNLPKAKL